MSGANLELLITRDLKQDEIDLILKIGSDFYVDVDIKMLQPELRGVGLFDDINRRFNINLSGEISISSPTSSKGDAVAFCGYEIGKISPILFDATDMLRACYTPEKYKFKYVTWSEVNNYYEDYLKKTKGLVETFITKDANFEEIDHIVDLEFYKYYLLECYGTLDIADTLNYRISNICNLARSVIENHISLSQFFELLPEYDNHDLVNELIELLKINEYVEDLFHIDNKLILERRTKIFSLINHLQR